jgi:hypothetical protein
LCVDPDFIFFPGVSCRSSSLGGVLGVVWRRSKIRRRSGSLANQLPKGQCGIGLRNKSFFAPAPKTSPNGLFRVGVGLHSGGGTPKLFFAAPAVSRGCAEYSPSRPGYADLFVGTGVQSQISKTQESRPARRPSFPAEQIFAKDAANPAFKSVLILRIGMPPKKGRGRPKKQFKGAAARNKIESDARKEAAVTPVQDPRDLHVTDTPKTESGPQPKSFKHKGICVPCNWSPTRR